MEFRWVALIALWTLLSGPIFYSPSHFTREVSPKTEAASSENPADVDRVDQK